MRHKGEIACATRARRGTDSRHDLCARRNHGKKLVICCRTDANYALAGFGAGAVVLTPIVMIHAFPTLIRFSGVSFSYNFAYALFGELTPLLVSWLAHFDRIGPAHYIAAVTVVGFGATLTAPRYALSETDALAHFEARV